MDGLVVAVAGLGIALVLVVWLWFRHVRGLHRRLRALDAAKRSQSTRYGQITEQFVPLSGSWPWDPKGFRFLGTPIDGVQFTEEGVVFVEIKSASSRLSGVQRRIRDHVEAGRVSWREVRLD